MPWDGVEGWFLEWVKFGLNWVRFQFLKRAKSGNSSMFTDGFAFCELGSFSRFCVFTRGGWPQRHRVTEGCDARQWEQGRDEWWVMSHGFLRWLKLLKLL
jgi:hypothetical protein